MQCNSHCKSQPDCEGDEILQLGIWALAQAAWVFLLRKHTTFVCYFLNTSVKHKRLKFQTSMLKW